jgi:ferrous iron transport protein A
MAAKGNMTLADLKLGEEAVIAGISGDLSLKRRLSAMGIVNGVKVTLGHTAPMGDPRTYDFLDYTLSLRNTEARQIRLQPRD